MSVNNDINNFISETINEQINYAIEKLGWRFHGDILVPAEVLGNKTLPEKYNELFEFQYHGFSVKLPKTFWQETGLSDNLNWFRFRA